MSTPICTVQAAAVICEAKKRTLEIRLHEGCIFRFEFPDTRAAQRLGRALDQGRNVALTMKGESHAY